MLISIFAWVFRFGLFAAGNPGARLWMLVLMERCALAPQCRRKANAAARRELSPSDGNVLAVGDLRADQTGQGAQAVRRAARPGAALCASAAAGAPGAGQRPDLHDLRRPRGDRRLVHRRAVGRYLHGYSALSRASSRRSGGKRCQPAAIVIPCLCAVRGASVVSRKREIPCTDEFGAGPIDRIRLRSVRARLRIRHRHGSTVAGCIRRRSRHNACAPSARAGARSGPCDYHRLNANASHRP